MTEVAELKKAKKLKKHYKKDLDFSAKSQTTAIAQIKINKNKLSMELQR